MSIQIRLNSEWLRNDAVKNEPENEPGVNVTWHFSPTRPNTFTAPDPEVVEVVAGPTLDAATVVPDIVVEAPEVAETPEEQLLRFIRENGAREAAEYAARQAQPGSALIAPDPRRRGGF